MPTRAKVYFQEVVPALGEVPQFNPGDKVRISARAPIGHYRLPTYLRGKIGRVETVIATMAVDNEKEAYGRNAGSKGYYFRVAIRLSEIWPDYAGQPMDGLRIEIFENWLERT